MYTRLILGVNYASRHTYHRGVKNERNCWFLHRTFPASVPGLATDPFLCEKFMLRNARANYSFGV